MRNALPKNGPKIRESAIMDCETGLGTHWVAYKNRGNDVYYFDSFGNLKPLKDLSNYLGVDTIKYNYKSFQTFNIFNCSHICLEFLSEKLI